MGGTQNEDGDVAAAEGRDARIARDAVRMAAFGHVCWLMGRSEVHRHLFFTDADWLIMPPIILNQHRLWVREGLPVGYASWACVGPEVSARMAQGVRRLAPTDWKSGDEWWLIDLIAPFGGQDEMLAGLKDTTFKDREVRTLRAESGELRPVSL